MVYVVLVAQAAWIWSGVWTLELEAYNGAWSLFGVGGWEPSIREAAYSTTPYVLRAERVVRLMLIPVLRVACVDTIAWARAVSVREPMRPVRAHTAIYAACRCFIFSYSCPIWLTSAATVS